MTTNAVGYSTQRVDVDMMKREINIQCDADMFDVIVNHLLLQSIPSLRYRITMLIAKKIHDFLDHLDYMST